MNMADTDELTSSSSDDYSLKPCLTVKPARTRAPDGGYGWVIVCSSFCIATLIANGGMYGVFYIELTEYFQESKAATAWPASLNIGFGLGAGPLASILSNRIGHRLTCMLGGVMCAVGFLICAFAESIYYWYAGYGVFCGIGYSLQFVTLTVMVGSYFSKRRNLATGLAVSGIGVGIFLNAPLVDLCVHYYTWRGAAIIFSALSLQACVFAALMRPLPGITDCHDEDETFLPDLSLLKEWRLIIFALVELLWNIGSAIYTSLLPDFAYTRGVSKSESGMLLSHMGLGSLLGRLILAFGTNCKSCNPIILYIVATFVSGLTMFITIGTLDYVLFVICSVVYGACFGLQAGLAPVITANLFGVERLTAAYGYLLLGDGLGCVIGPPFAGFMFDETSSYTIPWLTCGLLTCLASLLMTPLLLKHAARGDNSPSGSDEMVSMATQMDDFEDENNVRTVFRKVDEKKVIQSVTNG